MSVEHRQVLYFIGKNIMEGINMFRFKGPGIRDRAIQITDKMFIMAENLECRYNYKFAIQHLRQLIC